MDWILSSERKPEKHLPVFAFNGQLVIRAMWVPAYTIDCDDKDFDGDPVYGKEQDAYFWPEGWYEWNSTDETHWLLYEEITHWMPMPDKPRVQP